MKNWQLRDWIWKLTMSSTKKLILLCLAEHYGPTREIYPSQQRIAQMTGLGLRTVTRTIAKLAAEGVITIEKKRTRTGNWTANSYRINVPPCANVASGESDLPRAIDDNDHAPEWRTKSSTKENHKENSVPPCDVPPHGGTSRTETGARQRIQSSSTAEDKDQDSNEEGESYSETSTASVGDDLNQAVRVRRQIDELRSAKRAAGQ